VEPRLDTAVELLKSKYCTISVYLKVGDYDNQPSYCIIWRVRKLYIKSAVDFVTFECRV
jgi:hypothetical protein